MRNARAKRQTSPGWRRHRRPRSGAQPADASRTLRRLETRVGVGENAHVQVFLKAVLEQHCGRRGFERVDLGDENVTQGRAHRVWIAMGAALRLLDDAIDQTQRVEVGGRELERLGGTRRLGTIAPENGGAALR